jgi:hypothetical protein
VGKSPDDLPLDDTPLRRLEPVDVRDTEWYQFLQELDGVIESGDYDWAGETLNGIRTSVDQFKSVTPGQRQAVANIQAARGRSDGWRRRYEGFDRRRGGW